VPKKFAKDVDTTIGAGHLKAGLGALKAVDRARISISDTRSLAGSADVDTAFSKKQPNAHRWDYLIGQGRSRNVALHWIEVHPAQSGEDLRVVLRKLDWLKNLISSTSLDSYRPRQFVWIASGRTAFNPRSLQQKQIASVGCTLVSHLTI
jgi:hypothetical protein